MERQAAAADEIEQVYVVKPIHSFLSVDAAVAASWSMVWSQVLVERVTTVALVLSSHLRRSRDRSKYYSP